jgi:hypothetical protein
MDKTREGLVSYQYAAERATLNAAIHLEQIPTTLLPLMISETCKAMPTRKLRVCALERFANAGGKNTGSLSSWGIVNGLVRFAGYVMLRTAS